MDPSIAVPLQFSIDAALLASAVLVGVWWVVRRQPFGIVGAALLVLAQIVFAAQLITPDDSLWLFWGVVRVVATAALLVPLLGEPVEWWLLAVGAVAVVDGGLWQTLAEHDAVELPAGARVLFVTGAVALAAWAWRRSRSAVRLRILSSLIVVLAVVIVVAGGAVLRVATTNALNDASSDIMDAAVAERDRLTRTAKGLVQQAVTSSALVSAASDRAQAVEGLRSDVLSDLSFVVLVTRDGDVTSQLEPDERDRVVSSPAVSAAFEGRSVTASLQIEGAPVLGVAPVYASAASREPSDIVGALVLGERVEAPSAERLGAGVEVFRVREGETISTERTDALLTASVPVDYDVGPQETIVLTRPASAVVEGATSASRALVGALLAAALLAVVIALWVGDRLTRPILDAVEGAEVVKAQFLDSLSHELRTPLTPIRGYTDLLRRDRGRSRRGAYLDEIQGAAQRLDRIVTLLVDVATIQAGRLQVAPEPIDVRDLLTEVARRWSQIAGDHSFKVRVPKSAPKATGDPGLVRRVLDELVDNAVKFSPDGGEVELRARKVSDEVELSVSDEGIGLDPETVSALSSAFVQAEPGHTRRFGGLGLGLTYASGVLAAHDSRLRPSSDGKRGSRFAFCLPANGMVARMPGDRSTS